jgi:hypothetical protein
MSFKNYSTTLTVAAGETCSSAANISGLASFGIIAPSVTSCALFLQVAAGETMPSSASFVRLSALSRDGGLNPVASGQAVLWSWAMGVGSNAAVVDNAAAPWSWARVECGVTQAGGASFTLIGRAS